MGVERGDWGFLDLSRRAGHVLARNTVMKALRCLAGDGLAAIVPGWRTFRAR